jgi:chitin disaccharide deacetylase
MPRLLIVNADDFGLSPGVNDGIVEAHARGIVTSASLMVGAPGATAAAARARKCADLSLGLHFVEPEDADLDDPAQAARAFATQLERFRKLVGSDPTHVDSHHHVHADARRMATFSALVAPLGVPLRHDGRVPHIGGFYAQWEPGVTDLGHVSREFLVELVGNEALEGFSELGCHPARVTDDFSSSYVREREVELRTLTDPGLRDELETIGVRLVSFRDWARAQTRRQHPAG